MSIVLARIDDRLIHGQVTEGWGRALKPDLIIVISDDIACSGWEKELCLAALPDTVEGSVVAVDEAPGMINAVLGDDDRHVFVLFESPRDALRTIEGGAKLTEINVGGMHSELGKREILDYIYVDDDDTRYLKAIAVSGVKLDFRDLPGSERAEVLSILERRDR